MRQLRVNSALARQAQEVQPPAAGVSHAIEQHRIAEELAIADHQVDPHDVHQKHSACADVQMADLAVSHLSLRQSDERSGSMNQSIGKFAQ